MGIQCQHVNMEPERDEIFWRFQKDVVYHSPSWKRAFIKKNSHACIKYSNSCSSAVLYKLSLTKCPTPGADFLKAAAFIMLKAPVKEQNWVTTTEEKQGAAKGCSKDSKTRTGCASSYYVMVCKSKEDNIMLSFPSCFKTWISFFFCILSYFVTHPFLTCSIDSVPLCTCEYVLRPWCARVSGYLLFKPCSWIYLSLISVFTVFLYVVTMQMFFRNPLTLSPKSPWAFCFVFLSIKPMFQSDFLVLLLSKQDLYS